MKLKALDQIHVSSVKADSLQPGEEFEVSAATGKELLAKHPSTFQQIEEPEVSPEKAEPAPENKAEPAAPANKATKKGK
jgi:hypothetical protein